MAMLAGVYPMVQWWNNNVFPLPLNQIHTEEEGSQVRQGGIIPSHVKDLVEDIGLKGQVVPISVGEPFPAGHPHAGKRPLLEGNHRTAALKRLYKLHASNPTTQAKFAIAKAVECKFKSDEERIEYQLECNDHHPAKRSTSADLARVLKDEYLCKNGVNGITWDNYNENKNYYSTLVDWLKSAPGFMVPTIDKRRRIVNNAVKGSPGAHLINYDSTNHAAEYFSEDNGFGWDGKKAAEISGGYTALFVNDPSHVVPNINGGAFNIKTKNPDVQVVAVAWIGKTNGKDAKDIKKARCATLRNINVMNASKLLRPGAKLVDHVVFLPQLKSELPNGLIPAKKVSGKKVSGKKPTEKFII